ncbi:MAG: SDR family NAD(P)-dependent oxidoreductase [Phycisphaerae bacterium]|nr:SDR family NAD(P)-dependent oxidoreductase [Phycisphaerae bacterium]
MPKVLITGGAGFIGSHLAERLLNRGDSVVVIDNLSTGRLENIEHLRENQLFEFIKGDICDAKLMRKLVKDCDSVYHLAAAVGVRLIAEDPVHTIETNIGGTEVVLDVVNEFKRKIIIASTSEIYGKSEKVPFGEDDDIVLGCTQMSRWAYACSKAVDEFLGLAFYRQFGLEVIIARFFNTIGPRQSGQCGMVVPRFVKAALNGHPIEIYGTGKQSRCFCYVGDVVDAVLGLMASEKAVGQVFNIGTQEEVTIEQLADKVIELTGSEGSKRFIDYKTAYGMEIEDMQRRMPSIEKIKRTIGWEPKVRLEETLKLIIESMK